MLELLLLVLALTFSRGEATPQEVHDLVDQAAVTAGVGTSAITTTTEITATMAVANWPKTAEGFVAWVTEEQPDPPSDKSWIPLEVSEISRALGEPNSWRAPREKDLEDNIVPYWVRNPTAEMQDGWMFDPKDREALGRENGSGIPPGWHGLVTGVTFRQNP